MNQLHYVLKELTWLQTEMPEKMYAAAPGKCTEEIAEV